MPHLAVMGTQPPSKCCHLRRISGENADDVAPAIGTAAARRESQSRPSFDLPVGRYLHTAAVACGHVSTTLVGNESRALPNSKARPGSDQAPVEPEGCGRRSGWLAADLRVGNVAVTSGGRLTAHRHPEGTTELPATIRAERRAISMTGCAPSDIGVAEVHDSSTRTELISYEEVGFTEPAAVSAVTILEGPVTDGR